MVIQRSYNINPDEGFVGRIAEPNAPTRIEVGFGVEDFGGGRSHPRPGDPATWTSNNLWASANNIGSVRSSHGIFTFPADIVQTASSFVEYPVGNKTKVYIMTMGVIWLLSGDTIEYGQEVQFNTGAAELNYHVNARETDIANFSHFPIFSVDHRTITDGDVFKAAIGYGRAI